MTKDVQHDRSASPLTSVSDEIIPKTLEPTPEGPEPAGGSIGHDPHSASAASAAAERDSFEGFGSFG